MAEVKTKLRYLGISPRKVRLATRLIQGKSARIAGSELKFSEKNSARMLEKLLRSALANAKHNFGLEAEKLFIKEVRVDQGPTLKRFAPRAFGRAYPIRKRSSHITLVLSDEEITKTKSQNSKRK